MPHVMIKHKVKNFTEWKPIFDEYGIKRKAAGEKNYQIFHNSDDTNNVVVLFEWDTIEHAHMFIESDDLRVKMQEAGVIDKPEVIFLNKGEEGIV